MPTIQIITPSTEGMPPPIWTSACHFFLSLDCLATAPCRAPIGKTGFIGGRYWRYERGSVGSMRRTRCGRYERGSLIHREVGSCWRGRAWICKWRLHRNASRRVRDFGRRRKSRLSLIWVHILLALRTRPSHWQLHSLLARRYIHCYVLIRTSPTSASFFPIQPLSNPNKLPLFEDELKNEKGRRAVEEMENDDWGEALAAVGVGSCFDSRAARRRAMSRAASLVRCYINISVTPCTLA